MIVDEIMTRKVITIKSEDTLYKAQNLMVKNSTSSAPRIADVSPAFTGQIKSAMLMRNAPPAALATEATATFVFVFVFVFVLVMVDIVSLLKRNASVY